MAKKSILVRRLISWLLLTLVSIAVGLILDCVVFKTQSLPAAVRIVGIVGVLLAHFPIKRSGKLLRKLGECECWGWSTKLIKEDIYKCVRHPHHLGIGLFMTSGALIIGYPITAALLIVVQWAWVLLFLIFIEEKECLAKFGDEYREYKKEVPMLLANPFCIIKTLFKPL